VSGVSLDRLADLAVGFAANVQPGQIVAVSAALGREEPAREPAASAYRRSLRGRHLLRGPSPPDALAGLDPARAGRGQLPFVRE